MTTLRSCRCSGCTTRRAGAPAISQEPFSSGSSAWKQPELWSPLQKSTTAKLSPDGCEFKSLKTRADNLATECSEVRIAVADFDNLPF